MEDINVYDLLEMDLGDPDKYDEIDNTMEVLVCCKNCEYGQYPLPKGVSTRLRLGTDIRTIKCPKCGKKKLCSRNTAPIIHRTVGQKIRFTSNPIPEPGWYRLNF